MSTLKSNHGLLLGREVARRLELPDWNTIRTIEIILPAGDIARVRLIRYALNPEGHKFVDVEAGEAVTATEEFPLMYGMLRDVGLALLEIARRATSVTTPAVDLLQALDATGEFLAVVQILRCEDCGALSFGWSHADI